jgi:hypothetical protein
MTEPTLVEWLGSLAFGAGGAWFLIKQSRKDVNGLGNKVNGEIKKTERRHHNTTVAIMHLAAGDKELSARVAELLKEDE